MHTIRIPAASCFLLLSGLLAFAPPAAADQTGIPGTIKSIHLRSTAASIGPYYNWVVLETVDGDRTYYWGGPVCPGKSLVYPGNSDVMVDTLAEYAANPDICIEPTYLNGQIQSRCLVSFTASRKTEYGCETEPR